MARVISLLLLLLGAFSSVEAARTYIANAYPEPIFAMVDADRARLTKAEEDFNANFNIMIGGNGGGIGGGKGEKKDWKIVHTANSVGFTAINSGQETYYEPKHDGTIYISIFIKEDGKVRYLTKGHDLAPGSSVIVSKDGFFRNAEAGSIWKDAQGFNHYNKSFVCMSETRFSIANAFSNTVFMKAGNDHASAHASDSKFLAEVGAVKDKGELAVYPVAEKYGFAVIEPWKVRCLDLKHDGAVFLAIYASSIGDNMAGGSGKAGDGIIIFRNPKKEELAFKIHHAWKGKLWTDRHGHNFNPKAEPNTAGADGK